MHTLEVFDTIFYKHMRNIYAYCGVDVTDAEFQIHIGTRIYLNAMIVGMFAVCYTVMTKEVEVAAMSACSMGIIVQVRNRDF